MIAVDVIAIVRNDMDLPILIDNTRSCGDTGYAYESFENQF
jgi:3-deoxy-D-arabino-heptulosonate 7-phosphate (DAHP) synthase